jgi:hypothetical protein
VERWWNDTNRGERSRARREPCPTATLPTTNPLWTGLGSNPGLQGKRPAINRLGHGTAIVLMLQFLCLFYFIIFCVTYSGLTVI